MENNYFGCEREYIEQIRRITQQNMLIEVYCGGEFGLFNLVDFYYRSIAENAILMFIFICALYPVLFMFVAFIADKYLSVGMQDLSERFKLSPTLAAVTLIAFANGSPDVLSSLSASDKAGGLLISLGSLYGGFIFSSTLVISNVTWNATGNIKLPRLAIIKELGFYFLSVMVIIAFGFIRTIDYKFIVCYLSVYVTYIITTLVIEKISPPASNDELEDDVEENGRVDDSGLDNNKLSINKSKPFETEIEIEEKDHNKYKTKDEKSLIELITDELVSEEGGALENIIIMPLAFSGMFTVSYLENPFMRNPAKYIIIALSITWIILTFELAEPEPILVLSIGFGIGIIFMVLEMVGVSKNLIEIFIELISVFAAIGWIKMISGVIIDFITFLAFYFNINKVVLSAILLSAGNTIGDFFGNGALSKAGSSVMAGVASYSGQIFNNFIGFTCGTLGDLGNSNNFNIFAMSNGEEEEDAKMPIDSQFIIIVIVTVLSLLALNFVYMFSSNFTLKKGYTYVLVGVYATFFCGSLTFGLLVS